MRGLVFALLAAAFVASVQGHRYRGPRFINLGITGVLAPVYAGYNRGTLNRFGSISGSSLSRTFDSTFLAGGVSGGRSIGLSSVYPFSRSTTIRGVAPFSGGFQSYNEFGRVPYVPDDGPNDFDGPLSGFGPGGGLGSGDSVDPYPEGPYGFDGPLSGFGPGESDLGPLGSGGPLPGDSVGGPLDGLGPQNGFRPDVGPGPYNGIGPGDGIEPYLGPVNGLGPLGGNGPFSGDGPDAGDGFLTGSVGDFGPLSGGRISGGFGPLGYEYESSLGRSGAGSVYDPYRGLSGLGPLYPNPYAGSDESFDLGDRFSRSGFSSSSSTYNFPFYPYTASSSGRAYNVDSHGDYGYLYNDRPGVSGFGGDFSVSGGGPGLNFNLGGGDGLGFDTRPGVSGFGGDFSVSGGGPGLDFNLGGGDGLGSGTRPGVPGFGGDFSVSGGAPGLDFNLGGGDRLGFRTQFGSLEGQGALGRGTGSARLAESLGSPGRYLEYNNNP